MTGTMTSAVPTHDRFERPAGLWYLVLDSGVATITLLALSDAAYGAVAARAPLPSRRVVRALLIGTFFVHVGEATVAYRLAKSAGMDRTAHRWARETFIVGFPSILKLRQIAAERPRVSS